MGIVCTRKRGVVLALLATALIFDSSMGFMPPSRSVAFTTSSAMKLPLMETAGPSQSTANAFVAKSRRRTTSLRMAQQEFDESKYTEAAWSAIATLTKAADFYEASNVEAPLLLDVLLNPSKHNAGDDAESAKRVTEKVFQKAGVNIKLLRSELEKYLAKQPKVSENAQKVMGRNLQKVLEYARDSKNVLGVSHCYSGALLC